MSLFGWFKKPAWQSRDVDARAQAVASDRDPALVTLLPQLLRSDPEPRVRRSALERIDDLTALADRMANDADAGVRERARERLVERMQKGAPLDERLRALKLLDDTVLLEGIARRAPERELRWAALEKIKRPGFIAERCLEDPDFSVRVDLLARIDGTAALERLAEQARTKDKRLFRAIRERVDAGRMAAGDSAAMLHQAEVLCASLEAQLRRPDAGSEAALLKAEQDWLSLRARLSDERFDKRFEGARQTLRASIDAISRKARGETEPVSELPITKPMPVLVVPASERIEPDASLVSLLQEAQSLAHSAAVGWSRRWEAAWNAERDRPAVDQALRASAFEQQQVWRDAAAAHDARVEAARGEFASALSAARTAVEEGQLASAVGARARALAAVEVFADSEARSAKQRLADLDRDLDKLGQWQRWSDNKVRMRLCDEVETLIGSGMHPDALATRLNELKQQWQALEHDPADKTSGLARRFRFLCFKAIEPAKGYFEKRKEVRGKRAEELGSFIERVSALVDSAPVRELIEIKRDVADHLRRLDEVDPKLRGNRGKQLKQLIDRISARIDGDFARVAEEKQKLINQLKRQLAHAELEVALDLCKSAQRKWKELGAGSRKTDQALWEEFRGVVDPWFAQQNEAVAAEASAVEAENAAAQALIDGLKQLIDEPLDAAHLAVRIEKADGEWRSSKRPAKLESRYERALAAVQTALQNRLREQQSSELKRCAELAQVLDGVEASGEGTPEFVISALTTLPASAAEAMRARVTRIAKRDPAIETEQLVEGRALLLEAEYLAGIDSPPEDREARLALQVRLLSERMNARGELDTAEARDRLRLRWWSLGPLATQSRQELHARWAKLGL